MARATPHRSIFRIPAPDLVAISWAGIHGAVSMIGPRNIAQFQSNTGSVSIRLSDEQIERLKAVSNPVGTAGTPAASPQNHDVKQNKAVA